MTETTPATSADETDTNHSGQAARARTGTGYYPSIVGIFAAVLLISNITAGKGVAFFTGSSVSLGPIQILPINTDGAFFLFPLAYILGDVLTEVYGFRAARRAIFVGFGSLLLASLCFFIAIELPSAPFYENQEALSTVIGVVPRLVVAGLAGYLVGQTLNAAVLVMIKRRTAEKHLWVRLIGSTVVGEFFDTLIFCSIAAGVIGISTWRDFINYVIFGFVWKTLAEVLVLPITYRVVAFLKRREPTYGTA